MSQLSAFRDDYKRKGDVEDLLRWREDTRGFDLLQTQSSMPDSIVVVMSTLAAATTPQDNGKTYGVGFGIQGDGALRQFGHAGGAPVMNGELRIYPELGYVLVGLSNLDPMTSENILEYFAASMPLTK